MSATMYYLTSPATDSLESLMDDAEHRARDRGCECARPTFRHFIEETVVHCFVEHTAPWCPLAPEEVKRG